MWGLRPLLFTRRHNPGWASRTKCGEWRGKGAKATGSTRPGCAAGAATGGRSRDAALQLTSRKRSGAKNGRNHDCQEHLPKIPFHVALLYRSDAKWRLASALNHFSDSRDPRLRHDFRRHHGLHGPDDVFRLFLLRRHHREAGDRRADDRDAHGRHAPSHD
jgi:hypothetical protein